MDPRCAARSWPCVRLAAVEGDGSGRRMLNVGAQWEEAVSELQYGRAWGDRQTVWQATHTVEEARAMTACIGRCAHRRRCAPAAAACPTRAAR